jgi:hypothetical protein
MGVEGVAGAVGCAMLTDDDVSDIIEPGGTSVMCGGADDPTSTTGVSTAGGLSPCSSSFLSSSVFIRFLIMATLCAASVLLAVRIL